jgi:hypothetical protein
VLQEHLLDLFRQVDGGGAQPDLLGHVLGLGHGAEDPVGRPEDRGTMRFPVGSVSVPVSSTLGPLAFGSVIGLRL